MKLLFPLLLIFLVFGCRNDRGEQLFRIDYAPVDFTLQPGVPAFQTLIFPQPDFDGRIQQALTENNVSLEEVDEISGAFARIVSLSGEDFRELREVELRICPVDQEGGCDAFDVLFSVDDLFGRRDVVLNLNPGLRNFKELVAAGNFRVELAFFFGITSSQSIDCRLEWAIRGVARD